MFILIIIAKHQQKIAIKNPTGYNRRVSTNFKVSQFTGLKVNFVILLIIYN